MTRWGTSLNADKLNACAAGRRRSVLLAGLLAYAAFSLWTLPWFPLVHSDEAWLASLTRTMLEEGSLAATEEFFVLTPRFPHAIKVLYHLLQMPFIAVSFSAVSARLPGWAAGIGTLVCLWFAGRSATGRNDDVAPAGSASGDVAGIAAGIAPALLAAVDLQLLVTFHTARQEALLVFILSLALWVFLRRADSWRTRDTLLLGGILGLSIGIHPNSFIIAVPFVLLILSVSGGWRRRLREFAVLVGVLATFAAVYVGLSYLMDSDFLRNYIAFGDSVGVTDSLPRRWFRFRAFFQKIYHQYAGTYYLPPVRFQLILFALTAAGALLAAGGAALGLRRSGSKGRPGGASGSARAAEAPGGRGPGMRVLRLLVAVAGILIGLFVVGKLSPPSIVFLFPPLFLLVGAVAKWMTRWSGSREKLRGAGRVTIVILLGSLVGASAGLTLAEMSRWSRSSYVEYQQAIRSHVRDDDVVLGNLNTAFFMEPGQLRVWRDLDRLRESGLTIEQFIEREQISLILYPDELDLIYRERPMWNIVYGNLFPYYDNLNRFLTRECDLVGIYDAPVYAMRLVTRMESEDARLRVYRVRKSPRGP